MSSDKVWWYAKENTKFGPHTTAQLKQIVFSGQIEPTDLIWEEGLENWLPASSVEGLIPIPDSQRKPQQPPPLPSNPPMGQVVSGVITQESSTLIPIAEIIRPIPTIQADPENTPSDSLPRVYHTPRLDAAFNAQSQIVKHGKITVPLVTLLSFLGGALGFFGLVGLAAYWATHLKNKGDLELIEKELYLRNQKDGLQHDITDIKCLWFKYGPALSYISSILAMIFIISRWVLGWLWANRDY